MINFTRAMDADVFCAKFAPVGTIDGIAEERLRPSASAWGTKFEFHRVG